MVGDNQRGARLQATSQLPEGVQAFLGRQEMQGQQTGSAIERSFRRRVDIAFDELGARRERAQRDFRRLQHPGGRIDADEAPSGLRFGEGLQLQAATRAEHQDMPVLGNGLGKKQRGHLLQGMKTRHQPDWTFGVAGGGWRIGEGVHARLPVGNRIIGGMTS